MAQASNQQPADHMVDEKAEAVLVLAAKYYAEQQDSYSEKELIEAGSEVNIPPELIQQAIREIEAQRRKTALEQQVRKENRRLLIGLGGGVLAIASCSVIWAYNALLSASARVDATWAQVENQMQRRADLLPSLLLIATAPNQRNHAVVDGLQGASQASKAALTGAQKLEASQKVDAAVAAFSTAYIPSRGYSLRQGEGLFNLQYELAGTANRLAVERMRFNQAVDAYNRTISLFPMSLVAKAMGMKKQVFIQAQSQAR
jgi:LemA protein